MQMGSQIHAPNGYGVLSKGTVYHLLRNDPRKQRVILVTFCHAHQCRPRLGKKSKKSAEKVESNSSGSRSELTKTSIDAYSAVLSFLSTGQFEEGIETGAIELCEEQHELPPWFGTLTVEDLRACDLRHPNRKISHETRMNRLVSHMAPLVHNIDQVLSAEMPDRLINAHARFCQPAQNEKRFRTAFYAYLCFGCNSWALHYSFQSIGHWDRMLHQRKLGRPSNQHGAQHGYGSNSQEMVDRILEGYRKYSKVGESLTTIYRKTLVNIFGCVPVRGPKGIMTFVHPSGLPFPNRDQFAYRVAQTYPLKQRQLHKYDEARYRSNLSHSMGRYTESVGSLMERTEQDGYYCEEVCKGYLPGSHLPPLLTVRVRCIASGIIAGVGFSLGAERASAYRMALFCAAIDKVEYARLFGLELFPEEWPSHGISPHAINDRGVGSTDKADSRDESVQFMIKEGTPSYSGQSKASVETLHPKFPKTEGRPTYKETSKSIPQLAVQEILRAVRDNNRTNIVDRLNNRALIEGVFPTPVALWNYLSGLGRTHAVPMRFEAAVRAFLTPIELTVEDDAVYFRDARFCSKALTESGVLQKAHDNGRYKLPGFGLDICCRHVWVDLGDRLIEVDAQVLIYDETSQLYLSVVELDQIQEIRRSLLHQHEEHRLALDADIEARLEHFTGHKFDQWVVKPGRSKRGKKASIADRQETMPYFQHTSKQRP